MKKCLVQLALNPFFGRLWVPENPILGTRYLSLDATTDRNINKKSRENDLRVWED